MKSINPAPHNKIYIRSYSYRYVHNKLAGNGIELGKRKMKIIVILRKARMFLDLKLFLNYGLFTRWIFLEPEFFVLITPNMREKLLQLFS
jgi:hypothetical protein